VNVRDAPVKQEGTGREWWATVNLQVRLFQFLGNKFYFVNNVSFLRFKPFES